MISRRCLIEGCPNINPCRDHTEDQQYAELRRNDREIARILAEEARQALTAIREKN